MSENTIFVKRYTKEKDNIEIRPREIWRYAGYMGIPDEGEAQLTESLLQVTNELQNSFVYKVCYRRMMISWENDMPLLPFESESLDLAKCLKGSEEVIIFAATIGLDIDRHIAKYQRISPAKALLMQAYGAERIEALCDYFCDEISKEISCEKLFLTPRFSPGYGDLPLQKQIDFFRLLDCNRQIGISLNESLLMTPSKSVTAIMGLTKNCPHISAHKCENCKNTECEFRENTKK